MSVFYRVLKQAVGIFFNLLNTLLGGNLPPFVSVSVVVEKDQRYLVVERSTGTYVFPGGFMRWRELPEQAIQRECLEETGLQLLPGEVVGYQSLASDRISRISTLTIIYRGQITGGALRPSIEGQPVWLPESELRARLSPINAEVFDDYLRYRAQRPTHMHHSPFET